MQAQISTFPPSFSALSITLIFVALLPLPETVDRKFRPRQRLVSVEKLKKYCFIPLLFIHLFIHSLIPQMLTEWPVLLQICSRCGGHNSGQVRTPPGFRELTYHWVGGMMADNK